MEMRKELSFAALEFRGAADLNSRNIRSEGSISSLLLSCSSSVAFFVNGAKPFKCLFLSKQTKQEVWSPAFHLRLGPSLNPPGFRLFQSQLVLFVRRFDLLTLNSGIPFIDLRGTSQRLVVVNHGGKPSNSSTHSRPVVFCFARFCFKGELFPYQGKKLCFGNAWWSTYGDLMPEGN